MSKTYTMWTLTNSHGKIIVASGGPILESTKDAIKAFRMPGERVTKVKVTIKKVKPHD